MNIAYCYLLDCCLYHRYGGPQEVTMANHQYRPTGSVDGGWDAYLASSLNVVVARIDGRGSGGRGDDWLYHLYKKLGTHEIQDQIAGARYNNQNIITYTYNNTNMSTFSRVNTYDQ